MALTIGFAAVDRHSRVDKLLRLTQCREDSNPQRPACASLPRSNVWRSDSGIFPNPENNRPWRRPYPRTASGPSLLKTMIGSGKNQMRRLAQALDRQQSQQRRSLSVSANATAAAIRKKAQILCHAPPSIAAIPDSASDVVGEAGAFIRSIGCSRRVFLLNGYLTPDELEGLAYRVRVLASNEALNSVLIATDDDDPTETDALPSSLLEADAFRGPEINDHHIFDPKPGHTWHVAGGYDPVAWFKSGKHKDSETVDSLMDSISDLALATRGDDRRSRVPVITIPHGAVTDAGYALCLSTYMIATEQTCFRILNPSRGLTFDPVGFSYILPRLGQELRQPSAEYKGCGHILALMGYEADASDMLETGLATHYMENPTATMGTLERTLGELPPWNQQKYTKKPVQWEADRQRLKYTPPEELPDHFERWRNVAVASTIHAFTSYAADGAASWTTDEADCDNYYPAQFDTFPVPWHEERTSDLVDYAAAFDDIFTSESTVEGILERFREIAGRTTQDPEEQEGIDVAADFVRRMEQQAPLALKVTYRLMQMGQQQNGQTLQGCMKREKAAQAKLMTMPDYENWATAQVSIDRYRAEKFSDWKHKSVAEVTQDEVDEVIG
jgi:enoyl-CoA hydratase/carnithine racemase